MNNLELNKAIAKSIGVDWDEVDGDSLVQEYFDHMPIGDDDAQPIRIYINYCASWEDLMPQIIKRLPCLGVSRREFIELMQKENPLRSLAECLAKSF